MHDPPPVLLVLSTAANLACWLTVRAMRRSMPSLTALFLTLHPRGIRCGCCHCQTLWMPVWARYDVPVSHGPVSQRAELGWHDKDGGEGGGQLRTSRGIHHAVESLVQENPAWLPTCWPPASSPLPHMSHCLQIIRLRRKLSGAADAVKGLFGVGKTNDEVVAKLEAMQVRLVVGLG